MKPAGRSPILAAMLLQLSIRNYATADALDMAFGPGMSVITGETGAGKSIILGALGLALGDRADRDSVRPGARQAEICAEFDVADMAPARRWLEERDFATDDGACMLRRTVGADGRSRGQINDIPATMASLKELGGMLIDIHGQHEHQSLLRRAVQQRLLDEFGVKPALLDELRDAWGRWRERRERLAALRARLDKDSAETQLLAFQLNELDELDIDEGEAEKLDAELKTLAAGDEIVAAADAVLDLCAEREDGSAVGRLGQALAVLRALPETPPPVKAAADLLRTAEIQVEEAAADLRAFRDGFDADPERIEQVNARLGALHAVARKHKVPAERLPALRAELRRRAGELDGGAVELERLDAEMRDLEGRYRTLAARLGKQRRRAAGRFAEKVNGRLGRLGMPHAALEVGLRPAADDAPRPSGMESAEFAVSTNPGQPPRPLAKIASGGELSRISLAIQVVAVENSKVPCLVFDEVDAGIGGGVAKTVGETLRRLGGRAQVLCVTHQAQVAGQGHGHYLVSKRSDGRSALTSIRRLEGDDVAREVARMLDGDDFSEESLAHARRVLAENGRGQPSPS